MNGRLSPEERRPGASSPRVHQSGGCLSTTNILKVFPHPPSPLLLFPATTSALPGRRHLHAFPPPLRASSASRHLRAPWSPTRQVEEKEERAVIASACLPGFLPPPRLPAASVRLPSFTPPTPPPRLPATSVPSRHLRAPWTGREDPRDDDDSVEVADVAGHGDMGKQDATSGDPIVDKYVAIGLGREAVSFAVLNYGDNPVKVKEFVKSYIALHEMGFTTSNVPELLAIHDNDPDKVIRHLIGSTYSRARRFTHTLPCTGSSYTSKWQAALVLVFLLRVP
ncbi:hypothetical protein GUJ93_ZPchr0010g10512 [Zizania palustris]|uniref:Uncharacterized protein n=1 Tax=Zizania palustris TaxID=103762 RepID=A0A8J5WH89_ZIZPA|nr:hypothetical protein GUJ93_ZPchr0010g10512 [Zizania palustris]